MTCCCAIIGLHDGYEIVYCPIHEAAPALLEALSALVSRLSSIMEWEDEEYGYKCPFCSRYTFEAAKAIDHKGDCEFQVARQALAAARQEAE